MNWNNVRFLYSAGVEADLRSPSLPEIALVGRSNVGKSSLINHLLNQKNLARVSKTPGKTNLLNFFSVDGKFLLVDLPGYGYAKRAQSDKERWAPLIEHYLSTRPSLRLVCQLLDSRHSPTEDDSSFAQWVQLPLLFIFTKSDLISSSEIYQHHLEILPQKTIDPVHYSIKTATARRILRTYFFRICDGTSSL
jgi:GTP-binding protein